MFKVKISNYLYFSNFFQKLRYLYKKKDLLKSYSIYFLGLLVFFIFYTFIVNQLNEYTKIKEKNFNAFLKSEELSAVKNELFSNLKSPYNEFNHEIKNNDTITKILQNYKVYNADIKSIISEIKKRKLSNIFSRNTMKIVVKEEAGVRRVVSIFYPLSPIKSIDIKRNKNEFVITQNILKLTPKEVVLSAEIKNNLYSSATKIGIEPNIIVEFANIFGFEVDFQRDIRKGDRFEIYYEKYVDDNDIVRNTGKIIYASMFVNNKEISLYNFKYKNDNGYYDVNGKGIIKALMKTPINGARLSSSFGMRKHPILGFNKMHKGTDFAAPTGTPIMASGSGTVLVAQRYKGYGNYILIRHNSIYRTAYAHLSKFKKGIRKGVKVNQGNIIGYVGSTGMSTGPHLHYEVIKNGKKINSQRLKLPAGKKLGGESLNKFEVERIKIDVRIASLRSN